MNLGSLVPDPMHFNFSENYFFSSFLCFLFSPTMKVQVKLSPLLQSSIYIFSFRVSLMFLSKKKKHTIYNSTFLKQTNRCLTKIHLFAFKLRHYARLKTIYSHFLFFLHPFRTRTNQSQRLTKFTLKYLSTSCICLNFHHQKRN